MTILTQACKILLQRLQFNKTSKNTMKVLLKFKFYTRYVMTLDIADLIISISYDHYNFSEVQNVCVPNNFT